MRSDENDSIRNKYGGALQPIHFTSVAERCGANSKSKSKLGGMLRLIRTKSKRLNNKNVPLQSHEVSSSTSVCVAISSSSDDVLPSRQKACQTASHTAHERLDNNSRCDSNLGNCDNDPDSNTRSDSNVGNFDNEKRLFSLDDFDPATWLEIDSELNISNIGFAAVMAAAMIIHPLVFATGAATAVWAVGAFHAVEKGCVQMFTF